MKMIKSGNEMVLCIQQALCDYLIKENAATGIQMGSIITRLSDKLDKDSAQNYKQHKGEHN